MSITLPGVRRGALRAWMCVAAFTGCGTVDPGPGFVAPEVMVDEGVFHCVIQPRVITEFHCATGGSGEAGTCHSSRSALRLLPEAEMAMAMCDGDRLAAGAIPPASFVTNFERVQPEVQSDPLLSPFYRRPVAMDSHPREIFAEGSEQACLIRAWISGTSTGDCP